MEDQKKPTSPGLGKVPLRLWLFLLLAIQSLILASPQAAADELSIIVSIADQKMYVLDEAGHKVTAYRVSTSQFGIGDTRNSYATPTGELEIAGKIGAGAELGTVFHHCRRTGEIVPVNTKDRDPIVTRIISLRGLERQNANALPRGIFIHGTPDERNIGRPVSWGCIRMKSKDVVELFDLVQRGTRVVITSDRVGGLFGGIVRPPSGRG